MQTKTNTFTFWRDNKVSGEFTLTPEALTKAFIFWRELQTKTDSHRGKAWYEHYYGERAVRCFITDAQADGGLSSVFEESDFQDIYATLKPHF